MLFGLIKDKPRFKIGEQFYIKELKGENNVVFAGAGCLNIFLYKDNQIYLVDTDIPNAMVNYNYFVRDLLGTSLHHLDAAVLCRDGVYRLPKEIQKLYYIKED